MNAEANQAAFRSLRHFVDRAFCAAMILLRAAGDSERLAAEIRPCREDPAVPSAASAVLIPASCAARRSVLFLADGLQSQGLA